MRGGNMIIFNTFNSYSNHAVRKINFEKNKIESNIRFSSGSAQNTELSRVNLAEAYKKLGAQIRDTIENPRINDRFSVGLRAAKILLSNSPSNLITAASIGGAAVGLLQSPFMALFCVIPAVGIILTGFTLGFLSPSSTLNHRKDNDFKFNER
jgi:hypothetical protein